MSEQYLSDPIDFNARLVAEFRANNGRLSGMFEKSFMLMLTTTGAKTGQRRTVPLGHWTVDGNLVVVASGSGMPAHPAWFHNIQADPQVEVELATPDGVDNFSAHARVVEGASRELLWEHLLEQAPFFADHQAQVDRQIPVIVLERRQLNRPSGQ